MKSDISGAFIGILIGAVILLCLFSIDWRVGVVVFLICTVLGLSLAKGAGDKDKTL